VRDRFMERYPEANVPAKNTVRTAVGVWREKRE